ncbi:MAG: hypothetical protein H6Q86_2409 [candidate division NC10 bacterium]|nr:hypothetical protein [candidate division NC10 bacterium]
MIQLWLPGLYVDGLGTVTTWRGRSGQAGATLIIGHTLGCDAQGVVIPIQALPVETAGVLAIGQPIPIEAGRTIAASQQLPVDQRTTLAVGQQLPTEQQAVVVAGLDVPVERLAAVGTTDELPIESDVAAAKPIAIGQTLDIAYRAGVEAQLALPLESDVIEEFERPIRGGFVMMPRRPIDWDEELEELLLAGVI